MTKQLQRVIRRTWKDAINALCVSQHEDCDEQSEIVWHALLAVKRELEMRVKNARTTSDVRWLNAQLAEFGREMDAVLAPFVEWTPAPRIH